MKSKAISRRSKRSKWYQGREFTQQKKETMISFQKSISLSKKRHLIRDEGNKKCAGKNKMVKCAHRKNDRENHEKEQKGFEEAATGLRSGIRKITNQ